MDRVLAIGPLTPPIHGMAAVTARVVEALGARGVPVEVVDVSPATLRRSARYHLRKSTRVARGLVRLARSRDGHLYLAADSRGGLLYTATILATARARGWRSWVHHHSWAYLGALDPRMRRVAQAGGERTTHVVLCAGMARRLSELYPYARTTMVVSNAALLPPSGAARRSSNGLVLGHLSNLGPAKGTPEVLRLFERLAARTPGASLRLAGPAVDSRDREAVERACAAHPGRVSWCGPLSGPDKERFFESIDVFVFPSPSEAEPLVVLEALRAGAAVLAAASGCVPDLLARGGGNALPAGSAFVENALPLLAAWTERPEALSRVRAEARTAFAALRAEAVPGLERLLDALAGIAEAGRKTAGALRPGS